VQRRLLNLLTLLSLLLCVAACVLWVRSYRVQDWVLFGTSRHTFQATGARGHLVVAKATQSLPQPLRAPAG
jgi:hypothetical protein